MKERELPPLIHEIASTPLVFIRLGEGPGIWCKLEFLNPSGSIKDRIARYMLEKAWRRGEIGPGAPVVEASSGSTSISLALVCAQLGLDFTAVMPEGVSDERQLIIRGLGGRIVLTPRESGVPGAIARASEVADSLNAFATLQFENPDNPESHRIGTGQEILRQVPGGVVDGVVSGVGTGGTIVGLYRAFVDAGCEATPVVARPVETAAGGRSSGLGEAECCSFSHRVPGVVEGLSRLYDRASLSGLVEIDIPVEVAIDTTRRLMRRGFPVGPSSGLNYAAAVEAARRLGPDARVVTVFPDRMERYFSTELFRGLDAVDG